MHIDLHICVCGVWNIFDLCIHTVYTCATQYIISEYCNCVVFYSRAFAVFYLQVTQVKQAALSNVAQGTFAFR